ncbi:MAG: hypothetical protein JWM72_4466 [Actinomycetia bacterium]|nr:hypothetical protein [Actinomycetes bacterium]
MTHAGATSASAGGASFVIQAGLLARPLHRAAMPA